MRLNEIDFGQAVAVDGYGPGFFRVGGAVIEGAVIVTAGGVRPWGGIAEVEPLAALVPDTDVLFIGTGAEIAQIPHELRARLEEAGLGVEIMSSPTAARSYNVLLAQGRRVAAALLPVVT